MSKKINRSLNSNRKINRSLNFDKKNEEIWLKPERNPNENEKRNLFGLAIEVMLRTCLQSHMYKFNNSIYLQTGGMPTGLDLTGALSDLFMVWWDKMFLAKLISLSIIPDLYARFKDDDDS